MIELYVEPFLYDIRDGAELALKYGLGLEVYFSAERVDKYMLEDPPQVLFKLDKLSVHGPIHDVALGSSDELIRRASVERVKRTISILEKGLKVDWLLLHMGINPLTYWSDKMVSEWIKRESLSFSEILEGGSNLIIHIENAYEREPEHLKNLVESIEHDKVYVCLDIGHAKVYSSRDPIEWIDVLSPYTREVHVHNNYGDFDAHLPLEEGVIDFEKIFDLLEDKVGKFIVTLEPIGEEDLIRNLKWLEERGYFKSRRIK